MRRLVFVAAFLAASGVSTLHGQSGVCEVNCAAKFNQPVVVFTDRTEGATGGYRLLINGGLSSQTWFEQDGLIEFSFPNGFAVGSYTFVIEAIGPDWVSPSDPNTLTVVRNRVRFR